MTYSSVHVVLNQTMSDKDWRNLFWSLHKYGRATLWNDRALGWRRSFPRQRHALERLCSGKVSGLCQDMPECVLAVCRICSMLLPVSLEAAFRMRGLGPGVLLQDLQSNSPSSAFHWSSSARRVLRLKRFTCRHLRVNFHSTNHHWNLAKIK